MSHYTRSTKNYGRRTYSASGLARCKECGDPIFTEYGGMKIGKTREFCSKECAYKYFSRNKYCQHNREMQKAKYNKRQDTKWIFNSPFRNKLT